MQHLRMVTAQSPILLLLLARRMGVLKSQSTSDSATCQRQLL